MNGKFLVYLKSTALEESTVVFLEIGLIIMQLRQQNVTLWNRWKGVEHYWAQAACLLNKWNIFFGWISL